MQVLTLCRIDTDWAFRDVTGSAYGHSPDIRIVLETAQSMAQRIGAHVKFTPEAESHYRAIIGPRNETQTEPAKPNGFWRRLAMRLSSRRLGSEGHSTDG